MLREELNKIYTEYLSNYLQKGYVFDTEYECDSLKHQKILIKNILINKNNNTRLFIYLEEIDEFDGKYINNIRLKVEAYPIKKFISFPSYHHAKHHVNLIFHKIYFNVNNKTYSKKQDWYTDNFLEALEAYNKHFDRTSYKSKSKNSNKNEIYYNYTNDKFIDYAFNKFKNKKLKYHTKYNKKDIMYIQKYLSSHGELYFLLYFKDGNYVQLNNYNDTKIFKTWNGKYKIYS